MPSVGSAYVNIRVNTKGFEAGLDKMLARMSTKMEQAGTKLGKDFERGLNKTNFDGVFDKLTNASGKATDTVANDINKVTTEARVAKDAVGDMSSSLREAGNSSRKLKLGGIGGGGGGGLRAAANDASFFESQISSLAQAVPSATKMIAGLYNTAAFGGTAMAGIAGGLSAAAQGIFAVGANAAAAAPAIAVMANGLIGLGQIGGVVAIAMHGVGEALGAGFKSVDAAAKAAGGSAADMGAATRAAARAVRDAKDALQDAYRDAARAAEEAARRTLRAEQALAAAQRESEIAQKALNAARKEGLEQLEDIAFAAEDASLAEERAKLDLIDAQKALAETSDLAPDDRARVEAELAFQEAELHMREAKDRREDADRDQKKAAKSGVEGTDAMRDARDNLAQAHKNEADASRDLADARREEAQTAVDNADKIADAQQNLADAQARLADAQKQGTKAMTAAATAVSAYQTALDKLSPEQQKFVKRIIAMRKTWKEARDQIADPLFEGLNKGLTDVTQGGFFDVLVDGLTGTSEAMSDVISNNRKGIDSFGELSKDPIFQKSFTDVMKSNNKVTGNFGRAGVNLADAFVQVADAAGPLLEDFSLWVEQVTKGWSETTRLKNRTGALGETIDTAGDRVSEFWELAKQLWRTLKLVGTAANDAANGFSYIDSEGKKQKGYIPSLTDNLEKFNDALDKPGKKKKMIDDFTQALENMNAVGAFIKNVTDPLIALGSDPNIEKAFNILADSDAFDTLGATATDAAPALAELASSILDMAAAISESGGMNVFLSTLADVAGAMATAFQWVNDNPIAKKILTIAAAVFAVQRAIKLMKGVVKTVIAGTLGPLITSLDNTFKKRKFKATGGVDPNATAKVAGAGAEAKEGTWEAEVLVHLRLIVTAIETCCATMRTAMGVAGAESGAAGAAGLAGAGTAGKAGKAAGAAEGLAGAAPAAATTGKLGKFAGIFGKLGKFIGPIGKGLKVFSFALRGVGFALRFMMGPWGMLILTLLPILWPYLKKLNDRFGIMDKVMKALKVTLNAVVDAFQWVWEKIKELFNWVKDNWPKILAIITAPIGIAVYLIIKYWDEILDFIKSVPGKIMDFLEGMWDFIVDGMTWLYDTVIGFWEDILVYVSGLPLKIWNLLKNIWDFWVRINIWLRQKIVGAFTRILTFIKKIPGRVWNLLKNIWKFWVRINQTMRERIVSIFTRIINFIRKIPGRVFNLLKKVWNVITDKLRWAWDKVREIWGRIVTWVRGRPDQFKRNMGAIWNVFKDKLSDAWEWVKTKWTGIKTAIGRWPGQIKSKLANIWNGLGDGLISAINWVGGKVRWLIGKMNGILDKFNAPKIKVSWGDLPKFSGYAEGGPVFGPGTGTSDSILARVSHGEHVLTAREVTAMGGHRGVMAMRKAALRGEEPGTGGGILGWVKDKYSSVKDALKKGMETAFKWVLSKFKGMMGDNNNIVKNSVIGMLEWAADKISAKGRKADEEAESAVASGAEVSAKGWAYPLANRYVITQRPNRGHNPANAVDIGAPMGTKVLAAHAGIAKRGSAYGYGLYMDVFHGSAGTFTRYAHLKSYSVKDNAMVKAGTIIALSDSTGAHTTGPHLHFEYNPGGRQTGDTIAAMRAFGIKLGGGGVVAPSAAGTLALIAEAGQHERVTPLDSEGFTPAERRMLEALEGSLGGGGGDQYHVHPAPGMDETHLADLVARRVAWKRRRGAGWR